MRVKGVVWVNLRAVRPEYSRINSIINRARSRRPELYVANWNRYSDDHPGWFNPRIADGIHLTKAGAVGLVRLVRRYIPLAARGPRDTAAADPAAEAETVAADLTGNPGRGLEPRRRRLDGAQRHPAIRRGAALMLFLILVTLRRRGA